VLKHGCHLYDVIGWSDDLENIHLSAQRPLILQIGVIDQCADRAIIRQKVHAVLLEVLSTHFLCAIEQIHVKRVAGCALQCVVRTGDDQVVKPKISISYAHDLALVAISLDQSIGLDLLKVDSHFLSQAWQDVAQLYLPPAIAWEIAQLKQADGAMRFAQEWLKLEAGFKCAGLALCEYSPAHHHHLSDCRYFPLVLPPPYLAVLALKAG
jgi:4'-phosphopantetheinyl transferase